MNPDLRDRIALACALRNRKEPAAAAVTDQFLRAHPEWMEGYGTAALERGREDAAYHIEFLAEAIEINSVDAYKEYAVWTRQVLESRGIAASYLAENLQQIQAALVRTLEPKNEQVVRRFIATALEVCRAPEEQFPRISTLHTQTSVYVECILAGQRKPALNVAMEAMRSGMSVADVYSGVLQPAMYEVGRRWQSNAITVAKEHMATAITQFVMAQLYALAKPPAQSRGRMVIAGVQGELHQLGAQMVSDILEFDGWNVRFLGTDMPHSGILSAMEEHEAAVIGVSATMLLSLPKMMELVEAMKQRFPSVRVLVGGAAFRATPELWREIGADAFAHDLASATDAARKFALEPTVGNRPAGS